jgi:DNA-binding NtrC family response regulator
MDDRQVLNGKRVLIVDDEQDILDSLKEILDQCVIDTAASFQDAKDQLNRNTYDALIFDIMGVNGYGLLRIAYHMEIPVMMLTAHGLSAEHFKKSIASGAFAYIPKEKMAYIDEYLADLITTYRESGRKSGNWFSLLRAYFENKFGAGWFDKDEGFRKNFDSEFVFSKEHLGNTYR